MKAILKFVKYAALTILILFTAMIIAVFGTTVWIYYHPQETWLLIESKFLPPDLKMTWKDISLQVKHVEKMSWDIKLGFEGLRIRKGDPDIQILIDEISLVSNLTALYPETRFDLQYLIVKSVSPLIIRTPPSDPHEKTDPRAVLQQVQSLLQTAGKWQERIKIGQIDINLADFQYISGKNEPLLAWAQIYKKVDDANEIDFAIGFKGLSKVINDLIINGSGDLTVVGTSQPFMSANITILGTELKSDIPMTMIFQNDHLKVASDFIFQYKIDKKWLAIRPDLHVLVDPEAIHLDFKADVSGIPGPLGEIKDIRVVYDVPFENDVLTAKGHVSLNAPIPLFFMDQTMRKNIQAACKCAVSPVMNAGIEADLWIGRLIASSEESEPALVATLKTDGIANSVFNVQLGASLNLHHRKEGFLFEPALDASAKVLSFKSVREILRSSRVLVPAPLNVLDGVIEFSAKSPVELNQTAGQPLQIRAEAKLSADLQSARQKVKLQSRLLLTAAATFKEMHINFEALVDDLIVELPPLDPMKGLPKFTLDSRIQREPPKVKKKTSDFKITLGFKVKTNKESAIKLLYPLADPFVPVTVDYGLVNEGSDSGADGFIRINPFAINYLKRKVHVDSLKLSLKETKNNDFPIEGDFHVQQTEYKVMIHVSGTTARPSIELSSEPYLERADIVSVLLFDRTRDNLAGGDSETAGSAQAAMADRAVGLFGLWAFAATPIRSFSYNAVTKVYSATILLGDGLTAGIGTSLDEYTSFEIRKRLSKRWVISTSWAPSETNSGAGEMVLQWEQRY